MVSPNIIATTKRQIEDLVAKSKRALDENTQHMYHKHVPGESTYYPNATAIMISLSRHVEVAKDGYLGEILNVTRDLSHHWGSEVSLLWYHYNKVISDDLQNNDVPRLLANLEAMAKWPDSQPPDAPHYEQNPPGIAEKRTATVARVTRELTRLLMLPEADKEFSPELKAAYLAHLEGIRTFMNVLKEFSTEAQRIHRVISPAGQKLE